jgi:hypothetical protein
VDMKELIERDRVDLRVEMDNCLPELEESRVPNSFLAMMQILRLRRQANDPTNQPQKSLPNVAPVKDDFVWQSNFIDSSDITDQLELDDYDVPKRPFPTDAKSLLAGT